MDPRPESFEKTWERYAWLSQDIKKEKAAHERRRANVKDGGEGEGEEDFGERQARRNIIRAKMSLTTPKYENLNKLKKSSRCVFKDAARFACR